MCEDSASCSRWAVMVKEYGLAAFDHRRSICHCTRQRKIVDLLDDCAAMDIPRVPLLVAAPMVRYSKLPFRNLVRLYGVDVAFTPMIYAKNFIVSEYCRFSEFSISEEDSPTIVQFASNDPEEFATAATLVSRFSCGVDLNCGCPQRYVMNQGYGCRLLSDPSLIAAVVACTRRRIADPAYSVSVKIRVNNDMKRTVDLCRQVEMAGVSFITVHGRTVEQRSEPPAYETIKLVKSALHIPVIANGAIDSYPQALNVAKLTGVDGVMSASGLLENPAAFAGCETTPMECVDDWVRLTAEQSCPPETFHQLLIFMLRASLSPAQRSVFNELTGRAAIVDFLTHLTRCDD